MGQALHQFELIEGGSFDAPVVVSKDLAKDPQRTHEKWVASDALAQLAGIAERVARKAISKRTWRGCELVVREEITGRGRGGKTLQVHVDSLPADLREAWYLERGIVLHEKPDAETGQQVLVPEQAYQNDAKFEADLELARWRHEVIRPLLILEKQSAERAALIGELAAVPRLFPNGNRKAVTKQTLYNWLNAFEAEGLTGLIRKKRTDTGAKRQKITRAWDAFFAMHIDANTQAQVSDELTTYIRSLWASGERGWRSISEKSTTRLIELSRDLRVVAFDALDLGRCGDTAKAATQFGVCYVNRRKVEGERDYRIIAVRDKDNAVFQDKYMPSIRRDYSDLLPRQIVVGDVHPVDIMMRRPDGTVVYPKAIAWYDVATNEIHMTFVLLDQGEGIRREHVAMSFQAMVEEWGLPQMLYLDNGGEYSWDAMIGGFTQLSRLTQGSMKVYDLDGSPDVAKRVASGREAIARSRPYNAKGKPGIEGAFGNIEQVFFATIPGWTAGDRMNKKTHAKGKDPIAFQGDANDFLNTAGEALEWYHKRPQYGRLNGARRCSGQRLRHGLCQRQGSGAHRRSCGLRICRRTRRINCVCGRVTHELCRHGPQDRTPTYRHRASAPVD
ncbi:transposase domain-containing protein [Phaeobacter inhibens]|uniref:transposase domain-containing protein n=1 Tax=Phaeobacter inhibens TaxID=221822 RepID=UPI0012EC743E